MARPATIPGRLYEALAQRHYAFVELLIRDNGPQGAGVLVEGLAQRGVPYRDASAYLWAEVNHNRLLALKRGKTWTFTLIDQHPALAQAQVYGRHRG